MLVAVNDFLCFVEKELSGGCEVNIVGITDKQLGADGLLQVMNVAA